MGSSSSLDISQLLTRGLDQYGLGNVKQAVAFWHQALAIDPHNETAREYLEAAEDDFERPFSPKVSPEGTQPLEILPTIDELSNVGGSNNPVPSEDPLDTPEILAPYDDLFKAAISAYFQGEFPRAEKLFQQCLVQKPGDTWATHNLSRLNSQGAK